MPHYCQCTAGHWNALPEGHDVQQLATAYCGKSSCRAPFPSAATDQAPGSDPLPVARILGQPPHYFQCTAGHWSVADQAFSSDALKDAACGKPGCTATLVDRGQDRPLGVEISRVLMLPLAQLRQIDAGIQRTEKYTATDTIVELSAQHAFRDLCAVTVLKFQKGARVTLTVSGHACAELTYPDFGTGAPMHPYCYPLDWDTGKTLTKRVTYADIGRELLRYTPDFLDMLLIVTGRILKQNLQQHDIGSIANVRTCPVILSPQAPKIVKTLPALRWDPLALLAVLVGSAACETGRGAVGFANAYAAIQNIKHDVRLLWEAWCRASENPDALPWNILDKTVISVQAVYPDTYNFTGEEAKRNSVGFSGSEALIKSESGQKVKLYESSQRHQSAYQRLTRRDLSSFARHEKRDHPYRRTDAPTPQRSEDEAELIQRRLLQHLEKAFPRLS